MTEIHDPYIALSRHEATELPHQRSSLAPTASECFRRDIFTFDHPVKSLDKCLNREVLTVLFDVILFTASASYLI